MSMAGSRSRRPRSSLRNGLRLFGCISRIFFGGHVQFAGSLVITPVVRGGGGGVGVGGANVQVRRIVIFALGHCFLQVQAVASYLA
jgi:hypothetical protein